MRVFVMNLRGEMLMPCSPRKARILLKEQKATIVRHNPFTIQLLYATGEATQETRLGIALGAKCVGIAITSNEKVFGKAELELRQDVKGNLETKKTYRRGRRNRKTRYRRSKFKHKTKRVYVEGKRTKRGMYHKVSVSFTSKRPNGWLPPSIQSRIQNTFYWIDTLYSLLPTCNIHIEVGKFDVQKMRSPNIQGREYQEGDTFGYHDVRYFVLARDYYTCQVCKKKGGILQTHHIIYKSHGGSNAACNLVTVCTSCHTYENHQEDNIFWKWMIEKKKTKRYKEGPFMNIFRRRVFEKYPEAHITYGSMTTPRRKILELEKTHSNDAIASTGITAIKENPANVLFIKQFRKKKRSLHEATARKGRKEKNTLAKRNEKNTKAVGTWQLNDKVRVFGQVGWISGFSGQCCYVKNIQGDYVTVPGKSYKQVNLSSLELLCHNANWQFAIL
ncbi:RNA-guided endonuclease IscB [Ectobacillus funiculus]|uniref:RNA-guided endonuclease IscB n=1 Tax=Ectobacillus funiculus TaxID=137993 RepID=UPI00101BF1FD|nr:RNA-guided endonuclease IscB [Ectobacillus funiculus]